MSAKTQVDLKPPPFACRGRQFQLHEPEASTDGIAKRARVKAVIQRRMIGRTLERIRAEDDSQLQRKLCESLHSTQSALEAQEIDLLARIQNLEQQQDTLELLLQQIDRSKDEADVSEDAALGDGAKVPRNLSSAGGEGA